MVSRTLTPEEQHFLALSLRLAATSFYQDAQTLAHDHGSFKQLVANFHRAASVVEGLAPLVESADEVRLGFNFDAENQTEG